MQSRQFSVSKEAKEAGIATGVSVLVVGLTVFIDLVNMAILNPTGLIPDPTPAFLIGFDLILVGFSAVFGVVFWRRELKARPLVVALGTALVCTIVCFGVLAISMIECATIKAHPTFLRIVVPDAVGFVSVAISLNAVLRS